MRWPLHVALGCALALCACASSRDVIPETHDVREEQTSAGQPPGDGYAYVAKRPYGVVALAEARGMPNEIAARAVDHLADALDACAKDLGKQGKLVEGAIRVVAMFGSDGVVSGLNVKVAPGTAVAANAILCVITPLKLTTLPGLDGDAGTRGVAIEATWGPVLVTNRPDGG